MILLYAFIDSLKISSTIPLLSVYHQCMLGSFLSFICLLLDVLSPHWGREGSSLLGRAGLLVGRRCVGFSLQWLLLLGAGAVGDAGLQELCNVGPVVSAPQALGAGSAVVVHRLSSHSIQWDLCQGLNDVPIALQGRFFTTESPRMPWLLLILRTLKKLMIIYWFFSPYSFRMYAPNHVICNRYILFVFNWYAFYFLAITQVNIKMSEVETTSLWYQSWDKTC